MQKGGVLEQVVALAAAQPCALGGEQNPFSSAEATVASDKASW